MIKQFRTGSVVAAAVLATPAGATVLVGSGFAGSPAIQYGVTGSVSANEIADSRVTVTDSASDYRTAEAPGVLTAGVNKAVTAGSGSGPYANAAVVAGLVADFSSAAAASLTFTTTQIASTTGADGFAHAASSYYLQYDFRTTEAAAFDLLYDFGSNMGCCGNRIELLSYSGAVGQLIGQTFFGPVTPGSLTASLEADGRYRLQISRGTYIGSDAANVRGAGSDSKAFSDRLSFSIKRVGDPVAAVPEPSTWAMMILGFGAVGGAMRRRRRVPAMLAG